MNPLLKEILNTPELRERGFTLRKTENFMVLRDRDGCCPLIALAAVQGRHVFVHNHPWSIFVLDTTEDINMIVAAADGGRHMHPGAQSIRNALIHFLVIS